MLSIPVVPYVADMAGRRAGVVTGCIIMLFGVAMVSIGYHIALFVVGRIVLGFGLGIAQVGSLCLSLSQLLTAAGMFPSARDRVGSPPTPSCL